jgi:hypothetical protein
MTSVALARAGRAPPGLQPAVERILAIQTASGAIPWFEEGPWDPWNHAECLMALTAAGESRAAAQALDHLARTQEASGGWLCDYGNAVPMADRDHMARAPAPQARDTNFAVYGATALWHHWRAAGDVALVRRYWPMARAAAEFVVARQHAAGDISWCAEIHGEAEDDAILAGCASIFASLGHAVRLGELVGDLRPDFAIARLRLGEAIRERPFRFDRAGRDRSGFAMDWYYPILCGALAPDLAAARLAEGWDRFVEPGRGCRCVATEPWVTVAETAELALTLVALGGDAQAAELIAWQQPYRDASGAFWMGWQIAEDIAWPKETPSWTQAALILAHDAVRGASPASRVLCGRP